MYPLYTHPMYPLYTFFFLLFFLLYTLLSQWEFLQWEIRVTFPKESQLQPSRATQPFEVEWKDVYYIKMRLSIL